MTRPDRPPAGSDTVPARAGRRPAPGAPPGDDVSVIVPTLDEEGQIVGALRSAVAAFGRGVERIVVDGGSRDGTRRRARAAAHRVLASAAGRGAQLNAGVRHARGEILVFLHADTRLEAGSGRSVRAALARPGVVGGCYRFSLHPGDPGTARYRMLEAAVRLRTRLFRTATGDQAIFTTRRAFDAAGGFPEQPLFEDVVFVRRLRRLGRFLPIDAEAWTSRRRWEEEGFWTTVALHWGLRAAFMAGVPPERLAGWYDSGGSGAELRRSG